MTEEKKPTKKANESLMNTIHGLVAKQIIKTLEGDEITPQDLAQAIKFLKDNNVSADMEFNASLTSVGKALEAANKVNAKALPFPIKLAE
jgi:hypothetical protein